MKFSQDFYRNQIPDWAAFYIKYDYLKDRIKASAESRSSTALDEVWRLLKAATDQSTDHQITEYNSLNQKHKDLCLLFGLDHPPTEIRQLGTPSRFELYDLRALIYELLKGLTKIQWYARVNGEAISRLRSKLARDFTIPGPLVQNDDIYGIQCQADIDGLKKLDARSRHYFLHEIPDQQGCPLILRKCGFSIGIDPSKVHQAIISEDTQELARLLSGLRNNESDANWPVIRQLLSLCIASLSNECFSLLINDFCNVNMILSCIKTLLLGLDQATASFWEDEQGRLLKRRKKSFLLSFFDIVDLAKIREIMLGGTDCSGRLPIHYAATYGVYDFCETMIKFLRTGNNGHNAPLDTYNILLVRDREGHSPLHLAVVYDHTATVALFMSTLNQSNLALNITNDPKPVIPYLEMFTLALQCHHDEIIQMIAPVLFDIDPQSELGEAAVRAAVNAGRLSYVKTVLERLEDNKPRLSKPSLMAYMTGQTEVFEALLEAGFSFSSDRYGWSAREHAAFRGQLGLLNLLETQPSKDPAPSIKKSGVSGVNSYDLNENLLVVMLGSMQQNCQTEVIAMDMLPELEPEVYSMEISIPGSQSYSVDLPVLGDHHKPLIFSIQKSATCRLDFKVFQRYPACAKEDALVGSGTALVDSRSACAHSFESLERSWTIPILSRVTLDYMGTITFTSLIAKPFPGPQGTFPFPISEPLKAVQLVGHRGFGQNTASHEYLQLGENTVESCFSAKTLGASFVEFDVQVTKDFVPVVYHDFSLSESGTDVPIHEINLNQDLNPTIGGTSIQSPFATFEDLLTNLPEDLGFVVELKYPRLHEAANACVPPTAIDLNTFVDVILAKVFQFGKSRRVLLASFTPEICILLAHKARGYPVLFITNAGKLPINDFDKRGASVQTAVRFAKQWGLTGVIFASEALLACPELVQYVNSSGLLCASYGPANNIPKNAKLLIHAGIHMLIVDRVALIAKLIRSLGLSDNNQK